MTILVCGPAPVNVWAAAIARSFDATSGDDGFAALRLRGRAIGPK